MSLEIPPHHLHNVRGVWSTLVWSLRSILESLLLRSPRFSFFKNTQRNLKTRDPLRLTVRRLSRNLRKIFTLSHQKKNVICSSAHLKSADGITYEEKKEGQEPKIKSQKRKWGKDTPWGSITMITMQLAHRRGWKFFVIHARFFTKWPARMNGEC